MTSELLINYRPYETRIALLENGELVEFQLERGARGAGLISNIYKGKVLRVLPGLQAAFVDIGLERAAFLYVDDVSWSDEKFTTLLSNENTDFTDDDEDEEHTEHKETISLPETPKAPIETLLDEGQELLVQISKEPIGQKGARVTTLITVAGRRLVFMSTVNHLGISRRIEDEEERKRLRELLEQYGQGHGFIARTAAEGASEFAIKAEASFLIQLWDRILEKADSLSSPALVHRELDATLKAVRDIFTDDVESLIVDDEDKYHKIKDFLSSFAPYLVSTLSLYTGKDPLFHYYNVEQDLTRALDKKVWLKSGGYVVIDSTEALTVIDVNTGRYVGAHNLEETILKTNLEAVREIAYQLRLRNIGGIIVIDFIDMEKESNRERVFQALKEMLRRDKGKTKILPMSELGLIEMTRKRIRENIDRLMREPCFYCRGQGFLLSRTTVCYEAFRDLEIAAAENPNKALTLRVHTALRDLILDEGRSALEDLERRLGRQVNIKADENMHHEEHKVEVSRALDNIPSGTYT
ncbi:MAG: Rne/Rng family ribonuclease [Deltaproteobacteria bacterium]|jgi:ribonuclease G|nr:Rne/Rng family ribonuclease [Deltaproteobacteria bacterium]